MDTIKGSRNQEAEELRQAAYWGKVDEVSALLAQGLDADGQDGDRDAETGVPYYVPLSEAARGGEAHSPNHLRICEILFDAGANPNFLNYRGETAFLLAAQKGHLEVMRYLIERGADPRIHGSMGSAFHYAVCTTPEVIQALVELGLDPSERDEYGRTPLWLLEALPAKLKSRRPAEKAEGQRLMENLKILSEHWPCDREELDSLLAACEKAGGAAKKEDASEDVKLNAIAAAVHTPGWAAKVEKAIGTKIEKRHDKLRRLCELVLKRPEAIRHEQWPFLVRKLFDLTWSFADASEATCGRRLSVKKMDGDESGAMDYYTDERLYTIDLVLRLLAEPEAIAREDWASLVEWVCTQKREMIGAYSVGDEEMTALLECPEVKGHSRYGALRKEAKAAFPYACRG